MAYSIQREVSDGTLQTLTLRIAYFKKTHIFVYVDDKIADGSAGYSWVWDGERIRLNKVVPVGIEVMIRRKTPMDAPFHNFRQGAVFKDVTMDENFIQQLYINQENVEGLSATDFYSDLDLHNYRMKNVGTAINDADAVSLGQYRADALGANQYRILAESSKVAAKASEVATNAAMVAAKESETNSKVSEVAAKASGDSAGAAAVVATSAKVEALAAANAAKASGDVAKIDADRAQYWADRIDVNTINGRINGVAAKVDANAGRIQAIETDPSRFGFRGEAPADLNTATTNGVYSATPAGGVPFVYGTLIVYATLPHYGVVAGNWITQIFHGTNHRTYTRHSVNLEGWTSWAEVYDSRRLTFEF